MLAEQIARRRWWIVGGCIVAEWVWVATLALTSIEHNGWIYQHGDDGPWYWTSAWALSTFHVPLASVGLGWPYVLAPFAGTIGPNMAVGLPAVVALNVVVLTPACVVLVYLVAERIAGAAFGVWAAVVWTLAPLVALGLFRHSSRHVLLDSFFPTGVGLNALSDFPSMAIALASVYLLLRTLDSRDGHDAALCGLTLGFLLMTKPANAPLVLVSVAALLVAKQLRLLGIAALCAVPSLAALGTWKYRGAGVALQPASGRGNAPSGDHGLAHHLVALVQRVVHLPGRYLAYDTGHMSANLHALREVFWSLRLLEFVLLAGTFALAARLRWRGILIVSWFAAFFLTKGLSERAGVYDTSVYRYLLPAWPAFVLMLAGLVFLWPGAKFRGRAAPVVRRAPRWAIVVAAVAFGIVPAAIATSAPLAPRGSLAQMNYNGAPIAVRDFGISAIRRRTGVTLTWRPMSVGTADAVFAIYRADGAGCDGFSDGAQACHFVMTQIGFTTKTTFIDRRPQSASHYRVGLAAGATFHENSGSDLLLLSKPVFSAR